MEQAPLPLSRTGLLPLPTLGELACCADDSTSMLSAPGDPPMLDVPAFPPAIAAVQRNDLLAYVTNSEAAACATADAAGSVLPLAALRWSTYEDVVFQNMINLQVGACALLSCGPLASSAIAVSSAYLQCVVLELGQATGGFVAQSSRPLCCRMCQSRMQRSTWGKLSLRRHA